MDEPAPFFESENGSTRPAGRASKRLWYNRPRRLRRQTPDVPTETPPPYFPQNPLSPGDEKTAKKLRLTFYGCAALVVLAIIGAIVGVVYLVRSLL
jgi:hypothetical protein